MKEIEEKHVEHEFSKDFLTGCLALIVIGLILFVLVPLLIFVLKLSVLVAVPIGLIAAFVIFTRVFWSNYKYLTTEMVRGSLQW